MRKTLFVDQSAEMGGAELSLYDIAVHFRSTASVCLFQSGDFERRLRSADVDVRVLELPGAIGGVRKDAGLFAMLRSVVAVATFTWRLRKETREFDVVYANTQKAFVLSALAVLGTRTPLIWHLRDMLTADHFSAGLRRLVVFLTNRLCRLVICNSVATRDSYVAIGGRAKTVVVYNGIDSDDFNVAAQALAAPIPHLDGSLFNVGLFGRLTAWKGQHVAIAALARAPHCRLFVTGAPFFGEERYEAELQALVTKLGLEDRVVFLGFRKDVAAVMRAMDAVVHTSTAAEPFGRVIVEAMLAERPVTATRAGGALEIIEEGTSGLFVEPGDADELAATLERLAGDPALRARLAAAGRRRAIEVFSLDALVTRIETLLDEVGAARRPHEG